jgi:hypothetical protein
MLLLHAGKPDFGNIIDFTPALHRVNTLFVLGKSLTRGPQSHWRPYSIPGG